MEMMNLEITALKTLMPSRSKNTAMGTNTAARISKVASVLFLLPFLLSAQTDTLRLIFAGDIMGHAPQIKSAEEIGRASCRERV